MTKRIAVLAMLSACCAAGVILTISCSGAGAGSPVASGNPTSPSGNSGSDLRGCGAAPVLTAGLNELPNYAEVQAPALPRVIRQAERPAQVDLSPYVPTPCNQGPLNSCVGWAGAYGLMTYLASTNIEGWNELDRTDRHFSPAFVFNQANAFRMGRSRYDTCRRAGTFVTDMLTLLRDTGVVLWRDMPYDASDCSMLPDDALIAQARQYRIAYFRAVPTDADTLRSYLAEEIPVLVTVRVGESFTHLRSGDIFDVTDDSNSFAHAMLLVGYDDGIGGGAMKVMNSWGTSWGDGGFGFISYDAWNEVCREAFVVGKDLVTSNASIAGRIISEGVSTTDALKDSDGDGYPDTMEDEFAARGFDRNTPNDNPDFEPKIDTDGDGWPDSVEDTFGTSPESDADVPFGEGYRPPDDFYAAYQADEGNNGIEDRSVTRTRSIEYQRTTYETRPEPRAIAHSDFDGDGDQDILLASGYSNAVLVYFNDGEGNLSTPLRIPVLGTPTFLTVADLNADGVDDAALGVDLPGQLGYVLQILNDGNGGFQLAVDVNIESGAVSATTADFDGDLLADMAIAIAGINAVAVLVNRDGHFEELVLVELPAPPTGVRAADIDADGDFDIAVSLDDLDGLLWLENDGSGVLTEGPRIETETSANAVELVDLNGDGLQDLVVASYAGESGGVLVNEGGLAFSAATEYAVGAGPLAVAGGDLDNDGDIDLVLANAEAQTISILPNVGTASFLSSFDYRTTGPPAALTVVDLDGDNMADIVTAEQGPTEDDEGSMTVFLSGRRRVGQ